MDFLRFSADRDLYLVECSTYALSQINLITGLLGHGKLVSFYAAYRCGSCSDATCGLEAYVSSAGPRCVCACGSASSSRSGHASSYFLSRS